MLSYTQVSILFVVFVCLSTLFLLLYIHIKIDYKQLKREHDNLALDTARLTRDNDILLDKLSTNNNRTITLETYVSKPTELYAAMNLHKSDLGLVTTDWIKEKLYDNIVDQIEHNGLSEFVEDFNPVSETLVYKMQLKVVK